MTGTPIAIVVPPNAQSLDISGPLDAVLEANRLAPDRCNYDVRLLSIGPDRAVTAGAMSIVTHGSIFEDEQPIDTLLIAGTPDYARAYTESATPCAAQPPLRLGLHRRLLHRCRRIAGRLQRDDALAARW